jgi:hypothetical protein
MSIRYNHVCALAFSLETSDPDGLLLEDAAAARRAILTRLASLDDEELIEAIGDPEDTSEVEENPATA